MENPGEENDPKKELFQEQVLDSAITYFSQRDSSTVLKNLQVESPSMMSETPDGFVHFPTEADATHICRTLQTLDSRISTLETRCEVISSQISDIVTGSAKIEGSFDLLSIEVDNINLSIVNMKTDITRLSRLCEIFNVVDTMYSDYKNVKSESEGLRKDVSTLQEDVRKLRSDLEKLDNTDLITRILRIEKENVALKSGLRLVKNALDEQLLNASVQPKGNMKFEKGKKLATYVTAVFCSVIFWWFFL